jgi:hypothetical protein
MNSHITNIVRSVVFLGCALPLTIAFAGRVNVGTEAARLNLEVSPSDQILIDLKNDLTKACIQYKVGKVDGTVERKAKTAIDEVFDGEVIYNATCNVVLS